MYVTFGPESISFSLSESIVTFRDRVSSFLVLLWIGYGKHNILAKFDARITWEEMYDLYKNEIYLKAKGKYKN